MQTINRFDRKYFFLSNFAECNIVINYKVYKTVEHYFQAMKAITNDDHELVRLAGSATDAKRLGRKIKLRGDWDHIKDGVMLHGLRIKFTDPQFRDKLLDTGDTELIEGNTWRDTYWGVCNGVGKNMLSKLLMQIREELKR